MNTVRCLILSILLIIYCNTYAAHEGKFLLIAGPSGVGKSTIISNLKHINQKFIYVTPYTTRTLRPGENDKISISVEQMDRLEKAGKLLAVNKIYGIYYGTPKTIIDNALKNGQFPILDWPIDKIETIKKYYNGKMYVVYLLPDNINELKTRLTKDTRDKDGKRLEFGIKELKNNSQGLYDNYIDLKIINKKQKEKQIAQIIYNQFIKEIK